MSKKHVFLLFISCLLITTLASRITSSDSSVSSQYSILSSGTVHDSSSLALSGTVRNLDTGFSYSTIQEAIDAAETDDGHTIFVEAGVYYESVVVDKSLTLVGENVRTTIVDGNETGTVFDITRSNVNITGFTIQKASTPDIDCGIYLSNVIHCNITKNNITYNDNGISLYDSSNNRISGNNITNNDYGIHLRDSSNNSISGNNITNNHYGIYLYGSLGNSISGNNIRSNIYYGIWLVYSSSNSIFGNSIINNDYGIWLDSSSSNSIFGNSIINNDYGIWLDSSSNNSLSANKITNNYDGIYLSYSSNNSISGNNITNNLDDGISLEYYSNGNTISGNNITNSEYAITLGSYSNGNTISGNNITNNGNEEVIFGISLKFSSNNTVCGNNITNNDYGINLGSSSNNTVCGNSITNNDYGVSLWRSSNNIVYHNNFVGNTKQVNYFESGNIWDNGVEGNFWSNYTGVDSDHDGIGDTEHVIDENNTDHYPLMGMFSDFNATSEYNVQTISNSSISDFKFNATAISFNVTGNEDTTGFCRICIPKALMNDAYKVFVNGTEVPHTLLPCSNSTHSYLYFTYKHSTQEVIIIPELPSTILLPFLMISTLVAFVLRKKRGMKHQKRGG